MGRACSTKTSPREKVDDFSPNYLKAKVELAGKAWRCGLGEIGLRLRARLNANDGSNGLDIDHRRWSCVTRIVGGIVGTPPGVPVILLVTVKVMMPGAMPPRVIIII